MANKKYLNLIKQGIESWNKWRLENIHERPDFIGADLSGSDLCEANLSQADFIGADLFRSNLNRANLKGAVLNGADLSGSNLSGANLYMAGLSRADLSGADLSGANLSGTDLSGADLNDTDLFGVNFNTAILKEVDLTNAKIGRTVFGDLDLSTVKNLHTIQHFGPSTISINTIYKSKGKIPKIFLRGVGVPENFTIYLDSLVDKSINYYSCFISYSCKDQPFAERLLDDLQNKEVHCWFATEDMKTGDKIRPPVWVRNKLLLILSEHSISSNWIENEVETAFEEERKHKETILFPVRIDASIMKTDKVWATSIRRTRHIDNFSMWKEYDQYQKSFNHLLRVLKEN